MINLIDKFNKEIVGSKETISDYIPRILPHGDFGKIYGLNAILNSWSNVLVTPCKTYIGDPEYGSNLYKLIGRPTNEQTKENIKNEIINTIQKYDDRAQISDIDIQFLSDKKGFTVKLSIEYDGEISDTSFSINETLKGGFK